jgi:hypothetical protein
MNIRVYNIVKNVAVSFLNVRHYRTIIILIIFIYKGRRDKMSF